MNLPQRINDTTLLVPMTALGTKGEADEGVIGDGAVEVSVGDPLYDMWLPYV